MSRADHTFAISLIASLVLHACVLGTMLQRMHAAAAGQSLVLPAPPKPAAIFIEEARDASLEFGAIDGRGNAANNRPGDEPMRGLDADQTQAFLSRDPQGPGHVGDDPSMSVLPQAASFAPPSAPAASPAAEMLGVTPDTFDAPTPKVPHTPKAPPAPQAQARGQDATSLVRTKNTPTAAPDSNAEASAGGSPRAGADPAVMSDSESDPFAPGMSVDFQDGRVDARLGRKVKTVRPKLSLASRYDLQGTLYPSMKVRVQIDEEGVVRKVDILKSSGSVGADQSVEVALYQWWFEPIKNKAGHATASELTFPITWR